MYLLASDESKLVISGYKVLRNNTSGLSLEVKVDRTSTSFDEVETYFNNIIDNKLKLYVYNDTDEKEQSLSGFNLELFIGVKGTLLDVTLKCESENTYQIGLLQDKTSKQENTLTAHDTAINQHTNVINNQGTALQNHENQIVNLGNSGAMQMSTLEAVILNIIPTAISDAVSSLTKVFESKLEEMKETLTITELPEEVVDGTTVEESTNTEETDSEPVEEPVEE